MIKINRLTKSIRADATAKSVFEKTLVKNFCHSDKGTVSWKTETVSINCDDNAASLLGSNANYFLEAHCAGFCTLYGKGFKKYSNQNCTCKAGNARSLNVPSPAPAPDKKQSSAPQQQQTTQKPAEAPKPSTPAEQPTATTSTAQAPAATSVQQPQQPTTPKASAPQPQKNTQPPAPQNTTPQKIQESAPVTVPAEVHSTIVDSTGEGLIGASVRIPETNQGVVADENGSFTIKPSAGAKTLTITYIGMTEQSFPINNVPSKIEMKDNTAKLNEVVVAACGKSALDSLHASTGIISRTTNKCIPTKCINSNYELSSQEYLKDDDGEFELDDNGQKILVQSECIDTSGRDCSPMPANAKIAKIENGKCVIKKCNEPQYKLENGACTDQTGKDCTAQIKHAVTATYQMNGDSLICIVSKCDEPGWVPNDKNTKCEESDGPCTSAQLSAVPHAKSGSLRKGECIITECGNGWHPSDDGTKCDQAELSEADSKAKVDELRDNAQKMKDKEQSTANKMLGAAAIGATGIGAMNMMSGLAEQNADDSAEEDMRAYLATFVCDYGQGRNIKGGERDIDLPGGNELFAQVNEYKTLAADLKVRKEALGKTPGIESEIIYDIAETGLYDNVGTGRQSGAYASVSRALMDENSEDAARWNELKQSAHDKKNTGLKTAAAGALGGLVGNLAINSGDKNKNKVNEINNKYDKLKQQAQEASTPSTDIATTTPTVAGNQNATTVGKLNITQTTEYECINNSDCVSGKVCAENKCVNSAPEITKTVVTGNQIYGLVFSKTVPGADVFPDTFKTVIKDANGKYVAQDIKMDVKSEQINLSFNDFKNQKITNCIELQARWTNTTANNAGNGRGNGCYNDSKKYIYNASFLCAKSNATFTLTRKLNGITYENYIQGDDMSAMVEADSVYAPNSNTADDIRYEDGAKNIFGYNNNILIGDSARDFPLNPDFHGTEYSKCNQNDIKYTSIVQIYPETGLLTADMLSDNFEIINFTFAEKTQLPE